MTDNTAITPFSLFSSNLPYCPIQTFVLTQIEVYLATGTVAGLNIAWMVTDYTLFVLPQPSQQLLLPYHLDTTYWYHSIFTLVISTLWCPILLYCTGFFSFPSSHNNEKNENDTSIDHTSVNIGEDDGTYNDESQMESPRRRMEIMTTFTTNNDEEMVYM
jgi:hypothetical protein